MIELRPARQADADMLLRWRNDPATRAASGNMHEVGRDEHYRWLGGRIGDPGTELLIAEENGRPIGQVRLDRIGPQSAELSISLDRCRRGRGFSTQVLAMAIERLRQSPEITELIAEIRPENEPSRRMINSLGFRKATAHLNGFERYVLDLGAEHA